VSCFHVRDGLKISFMCVNVHLCRQAAGVLLSCEGWFEDFLYV
jgi:hypothetical protein